MFNVFAFEQKVQKQSEKQRLQEIQEKAYNHTPQQKGNYLFRQLILLQSKWKRWCTTIKAASLASSKM
jgi:hypothetical protein